jgi:dienelactone hydrolase
MIDPGFLIAAEELTLQFNHSPGRYELSFQSTGLDFEQWHKKSRAKLTELLGFRQPESASVENLRHTTVEDVEIHALRMSVSQQLSLPAYLLIPQTVKYADRVVLAIHGHGEVEPCIGLNDDYHHQFALELARNGYLVLCPELRGFGLLRDLALHQPGNRLDYWHWGEHMAYSLVTDGFQHGSTLIGETIMDLLRWEQWLITTYPQTKIDAVGISYGGDLALIYPIFSRHVARIFASGTLGSFEPIFARGYNAPAHCIPGITHWLKRSDIAGLNAPCPIALHYGSLDVPSSENFSASYNETVLPSINELKAIYTALGAEQNVHFIVSEGKQHEMDVNALLGFLAR